MLLQSKGPHGGGDLDCRRGGGAGGTGGDGSTTGNACDSSLAVTDDEDEEDEEDENEEEDIFFVRLCQCEKVSCGLFDVSLFSFPGTSCQGNCVFVLFWGARSAKYPLR